MSSSTLTNDTRQSGFYNTLSTTASCTGADSTSCSFSPKADRHKLVVIGRSSVVQPQKGTPENLSPQYRFHRYLSDPIRCMSLVIEAVDERTDKVVVLKRAIDGIHHKYIQQELEILKQCEAHPHVVQLVEKDLADGWLVLEYMGGGSFETECEVPQNLTHHELLQIAAATSNALAFLHSKDIIHRDVKPHNIFFEHNDYNEIVTIKLADLGLATNMANVETSFAGTKKYAAPEVYQGRPDAASDMWSWACTIAHLATGVKPYEGDDKLIPYSDELRDAELPTTFYELLVQCFATDTTRRPTAEKAHACCVQILEQLPPTAPTEDDEYPTFTVSTTPNLKPENCPKIFMEELARLPSSEGWQGIGFSADWIDRAAALASYDLAQSICVSEYIDQTALAATANDHDEMAAQTTFIRAIESGNLARVNKQMQQVKDSSGGGLAIRELLSLRVDNTQKTPLHVAVECGHTHLVQVLLEAGAEVDSHMLNDQTPLHLAARNGHGEVVKLLHQHGADIEARTELGLTPLHLAADYGHVEATTCLLEVGADASSLTQDQQLTPLYLAVRNGHHNVVRVLLDEHGDVAGCVDDRQWTPLHIAADYGRVEVTKCLIGAGADVSARADQYQTPLHIAASKAHVDVVQVLLGAGAHVDSQMLDDQTPLHLAAANDHSSIVQLLLGCGADPMCRTNQQETPLHLAARCGHDGIARLLLLRCGVDVEAIMENGWTPLHLVADFGHVQVAKVLLEAGADLSRSLKDGWTPLHLAVRNGHAEMTRTLLTDYGANLSVSVSGGRTPLHIAAEYGHVQVVKILLEHGSNASCRMANQWTPLHLAACYNHVDLAKELIEYGAEVWSCVRQWTPLHIAADYGRVEATKFLIEAGADVSARADQYQTSLHIAASKAHLDVVQVLLGAGAEMDSQMLNDQTPLHLAARNGHGEIVKLLLRCGADVEARMEHGYTPLHLAAEYGYFRVVKKLLQVGADVSSRLNEGWTPLHLAADHNHAIVVRALLRAGADVACTLENRWTSLHLAARNGHDEVLKHLVDPAPWSALTLMEQKQTHQNDFLDSRNKDDIQSTLAAEVEMAIAELNNGGGMRHQHTTIATKKSISALLDAKNDKDATALHLATIHGHARCVEHLLQAGANAAIRTGKGYTALHYAAFQGGPQRAIELLLNTEKNKKGNKNNNCSTSSAPCWSVESNDGFWPIDVAAVHGKVDALRTLLFKRGSGLHIAPGQESTLHWAVLGLKNSSVETIIHALQEDSQTEKDADVPLANAFAAEDAHGWTPLQVAAYTNNIDAVRLLCSRPNLLRGEAFTSSWNAKAIATQMGHHSIVALLTNKVEREAHRCFSLEGLERWTESVRCSESFKESIVEAVQKGQTKLLRRGGFGEVRSCQIADGRTYALKMGVRASSLYHTFVEAAVLNTLDHKNIIRGYGAFTAPAWDANDNDANQKEKKNKTETPEEMAEFMVMELMNCGSIVSVVSVLAKQEKEHLLSENVVRHWMKQALEALKYLHQPIHTDPFGRPGAIVIHHDIKPHNLIVHLNEKEEFVLKLADFGLSRFEREHHRQLMFRSHLGGTRSYLAPEARSTEMNAQQEWKRKEGGVQYTASSDIFAWAKTFIEVCSKRVFSTDDEVKLALSYLQLTKPAEALLKDCMRCANERPTAAELLELDYFVNVEPSTNMIELAEIFKNM